LPSRRNRPFLNINSPIFLMTNILDEVARSSQSRYGHFRPSTVHEFLALRLAQRLGEDSIAQHYADLSEHYSEGQLLIAYRRALTGHFDIARRFHAELGPLENRHFGTESRGKLAAIRIDRRAVAVAILNGEHLHHTDACQLSSSPDKALASTVSFITRRVIEKFDFESAALEIIPHGHEAQRAIFHQATVRALGAKAIGILETSKTELFQAFGYPPLHSRKELREIMSRIYPALDEEPGAPWIHDAAALGLYVQTERLFNSINQTLL
jgi:hypothetical protein